MQPEMSKKFSWSWSKIKNWRTCPKRHYEIDLARNFHEDPENDALKWGNEVHKAMADRIAKGLKLPPTMQRYEDWPGRVELLKQAGLHVAVENKMAMARDFTPTGFFDASTWFRSVIDVKILIPQARAAITIDWKTGGKVEPDFEQLALSSQVIFSHYPEIDQVGAIYVWFGHDTQTIKVYRRDGMVPIWNDIWPEVLQLEEAHRHWDYPPKPSGLCVRHCPVTSCPFHGKGTR